MSNIIIIGMPGSGKTTFGKRLADVKGMDFVDTDRIIEAQFGESLQAVVDQQGLNAMLALEEEMICGIDASNSVIATGGSVVYSEAGMQHLATLGDIVYLRITVDTLVDRVSKEMERGLFKHPSTTLQQLYSERIDLYGKWADITIDNDLPLSDERFERLRAEIDHQD